MDGLRPDRERELALGGLEAVFAANILGIAFAGPDERIVAANDRYLEILGFTRDDLLAGRVDWRAVTPAEYAAVDDAALEEFAQTGVSSPFEKAYLHPDGRHVPVVVASAVIPGTGGMATFVLDISAQKAAEEALTQRALILNSAPFGVTVHAADGRMLYANPQAAAMHGYTPEAFIGLPPGELEPAGEAARFAARIHEVRELGVTSFEVEHVRRDGSALPILATVATTTWGGDEAFLAILVDLSERRLAAHALLRSRLELEEAQRVAHVGSWTRDLATGKVTWSSELHRIYGVREDDPTPHAELIQRVYGLAGAARLHEATEMVIATGEPFELEATLMPAHGRTSHVVARTEAVRGNDGGIVGLRGTVADVTELHEAQLAVDRAQRVEMVGRLAGGVAHDFNNLLTAIGGHAEFLLGSLEPDDPRRPDVTSILDATARAADMTRQLLAFGRREVLHPTIVAPGDVIDRLRPMLRSLVPADVSLVLALDADRTPVLVDRDRLGNAVINLILNARDAMPTGGTLTISTQHLRLESGDPRLKAPASPGDYVQLSVADTGSGIAPELLPHIFEPFFTTKHVGRGSGMGLPSVDGFLAQSGGWVTVDSVAGAGSVFSLYLAVESSAVPSWAARAGGGADAADRHASAGRRLLLVDDEPAVRDITARLLRQLDYTVIEACDAEEALAACDGDAVDALVTDVVLPGLSGPDLAARCRHRLPGLPVLLVSGYARESLAAEGRAVAGAGFLAKPFTKEQLARAVAGLFASSPP